MKFVLIFAKTPYSKTPYDQWLKNSDIKPLILVASEFAAGYAHLPEVYAFENYDSNQRVQQKAHELVKTKNVIAIFARAEADILRAAQLRTLAKIPGQNFLSALAYRNKVVMKDHLQNSGVILPQYQELRSAYDVFQFLENHNYPVVIKPTSESGSFGTHIIKNKNDLEVFLESESIQNMEIETFVEGQMYHIDGFIRDGVLEFIQPSKYINDCLSFRQNQYCGSVTVSPSDPVYSELVDNTRRVLRHLPSPSNLVFHCELWRREDGKIVFCEIASRTGGAIISSIIEKTFRLNLDKEWFLAECQLPATFSQSKYQPGGGVWIPPQKGTLKAVLPNEMSESILDYQFNGRIGQNYNGGVKSGLFLGAFVLSGENEQIIVDRIHETAQSFNQNLVWG